jgi:hypothetical protein
MDKLSKVKIIKILYLIIITLIFYYLMFYPKVTTTRIGDYIFSKVYFGSFSEFINHRDYYYQKCYILKNSNYDCRGRYNIISFNGLKATSYWEVYEPESNQMLAYLEIKEELKKFNENNKDFKYFFKKETRADNILYSTKITENIIKILFITCVVIAWFTRNYFLCAFFIIESMLKKLIKKIYKQV